MINLVLDVQTILKVVESHSLFWSFMSWDKLSRCSKSQESCWVS